MRSRVTCASVTALALTATVAMGTASPLSRTPTASPEAHRLTQEPVMVAVAQARPSRSPLLKKGSRGSRVVWVQRRLRLDDDGIFGPATHRAVVRFQRRQGLDPDGMVGPRTWARLRYPFRRCIVGANRKISNSFGAPRDGGRRHKGIDVFAPYGTPVRAIGKGVVVRAYTSPMGGRSIILRVRTDRFFYAHQAKNLVRTGQRVNAGQMIGRVGTSGNAEGGTPHVHFERWRGRSGRVVDPYRLLTQVCRRYG